MMTDQQLDFLVSRTRFKIGPDEADDLRIAEECRVAGWLDVIDTNSAGRKTFEITPAGVTAIYNKTREIVGELKDLDAPPDLFGTDPVTPWQRIRFWYSQITASIARPRAQP